MFINVFDREHLLILTEKHKWVFFFLLFPFGNFNTVHFITEQISINTHLFPHLCASVFSADFKGHFTLLMTSVSDNR